MEFNNEQVNSDVEAGSSSETQNESPASTPGSSESQSTGQQTQDAVKEPPFHEHPRFKELVEQKNQYAAQAKANEERYARMEAQLKQVQEQATPKAPDKRQAMIERLKGIDPEFAELIADLSPKQELEELRQWRAQMESEQVRAQAVSSIEKLHAENKVPDDLKQLYNLQIEAAARANPRLGLQDLPSVYKSIHEGMSKMMDAVRRAERAEYVTGKKQDSKIPSSQSKGVPVQHGQAPTFSKDPAEARAQLIKRVVSESKAQRDL